MALCLSEDAVCPPKPIANCHRVAAMSFHEDNRMTSKVSVLLNGVLAPQRSKTLRILEIRARY